MKLISALGIPAMSSGETAFILLALAVQSALLGFLWFYPIIECSVHHPKGPRKDMWVLFITCVPLLGGFLYLVFGRPSIRVKVPANETEEL